MEQTILEALLEHGFIGVALFVVGWWGWKQQKEKDRIQEARIEDQKLLSEAASEHLIAASKATDVLERIAWRNEK